MEPEHPFVITRVAGVFLCALPAVRELYQYIGNPRFVSYTYHVPNQPMYETVNGVFQFVDRLYGWASMCGSY